MLQDPSSLPPDACPASAVVVAARLAKTPLAIAQGADARILFANEAFAALVGAEAASLVGRPLVALGESSTSRVDAGTTLRLQLAVAGASPFPAALSTAAVTGPDGAALCLLCSLVDARGDGADAAIRRDADLLAEVARAASALMQESGDAARAVSAPRHHAAASDIARDAVDRAVQAATRDGD